MKAIAIGSESLKPAAMSAKNLSLKIIDFMYGNDERVKATYIFALALLAIGLIMAPSDAMNMAVCAQ